MSLSTRFKLPWGRKSLRAEPTEAPPVVAAPAAESRAARPELRAGLPGFQTTAGDHLDRGRSDPFTRQRIRLRNAFTPAQPVVDPRMFAGRSKTLETMIRAVEDQRSHVIIFGERGVGKTSLLNMLGAAAREARYIVVYFSCGATSDFSETFRAVATEIPLLFHSGVSPVSSVSGVGNSLLDLLPPGKLTPRQFSDAATKLVGTRVLVLLDEFDRAESSEFRRDIAELIKTLSDLSARVQVVIAGVAGDLVDLMDHIPSIRRSITALRIPAMSDEEVRDLVENGERASGVPFQPDAVELVIAGAHGSPYLTNLICHLAGMQALRDRRVRIERTDVLAALDEAIDDFNRRLPSEVMPHLSKLAELLASVENGVEPRRGAPSLDEAVDEDNMAAKLRAHLEKSGLLKGMPPERHALLIDSLRPYLQLVTARSAVGEKKTWKSEDA